MTSMTVPTNTTEKMTSIEIAELTEKEHYNVIRDIKNLITKKAITDLNFEVSDYKDVSGKKNIMYKLDFEATMVLITGYDVKRRSMVIKRWIDLETGKETPIYKIKEKPQNLLKVADNLNGAKKIAELFGLKGNQALLSANKAVKKITDIDCMALLEIKGLENKEKVQYFTPYLIR